ncbi:four-carbon acid sugar kinase family protein [Devosia algicola]|uniref:Four-carbon acid sugar kinase family protein n=1 Tax=Devosia algicola TaxID=3026418 RepID=A0ABY7YSH5_9HYPH|nr:four-carbon acid sugar kinase family protein [Devosia algicola]WDR04295.1 four-carbon acid sugar kinase family protein [Devosia algicola]
MATAASLPEGPLLAFYGDDFTGSSAVMEVMTFAGLPTVMFLEPPTPTTMRQFSGYRAIGIASVARAQSPAWMDVNLPPAFEALAALGAPINHYKVCSTLDSSPTTGSIGRAIDIGLPIFSRRAGAAAWHPLVVAAPGIRRYQAFGNLFAIHNGAGYRLDRHPVMRNHLATPMREADVRRHISAQTETAIGLIDLVAIKEGTGQDCLEREIAAGRTVVALDVIDEETLRRVGALVWENRGSGMFAIGSQGIEYALVAYWRASGMLPANASAQTAVPVDRIVAVSGSVSSVTAAQIDWAEANGFAVIPLDAALAVDEPSWVAALTEATTRARAVLDRGLSPLIATARGPDDPAVARLTAVTSTRGEVGVNARIGSGLGAIVGDLVHSGDISRVAVAGGDTSGYAAAALGIYALEATSPVAPGAPLCRAFANAAKIDGLQIALKGGQMGPVDFFGSVRAGRAIG